jgi:LacI family transcriptional regulator
MPVTIKQIAELAGVAPTTVSLVLKDSKKIGAETKKNVLKIIEEMDYYPNHSGKLLKQGRTDAIAVLSSYFQNIYKMEFMYGVERGIFTTPFQLRQFYAQPGSELSKCKEILFGKMADVVITLSVLPDAPFLEKMCANNKRIVFVEDVVPGFFGVAFDNYAAAYQAVEYLAKAGRRRVAMSLGMKPYSGHCFVEDRFRGYSNAVRDFGLESEDLLEMEGYTLESGRDLCDRLLERGKLPDALFCASGDSTAAGFLQAALAHGIRVPEDIAVMGFDDSIIAHSTTIGLSTVRQPVLEMGECALRLALQLLETEETVEPRIETFKPQIVIRQTA